MADINAPLDERLVAQALEMIVKIELQRDAGAARLTNKLTNKLDQWRCDDMRHETAWREAMMRWTMLSGMGGDMRASFPDAEKNATALRNPGRRQLLSWALAAAGVASLGAGGAWYWRQPLFVQAFRTGVAQTLAVVLPDAHAPHAPLAGNGTRLQLNARSTLDVSLFRTRRLVLMDEGDVRFSVLPDAGRPFFVQTGVGTVVVRGTTFTVSRRAQALAIAVEEGHVSFFQGRAAEEIGAAATPAVELFGGQVLHLRGGVPEIVPHADPRMAAGWLNGWLNFNDAPLDEALAQINAYRQNQIRLVDAVAAGQRLTGRFRVNSVHEMPKVLTEILPLQSRMLANGDVELRSRQP
jgi:transmembrane sensor